MSNRKSRRFSIVTGVLFVLAGCLLLFSTVGGARAALNYESEIYETTLDTQDIGIALNTKDVVAVFLDEKTPVKPGMTYTSEEGVRVINTGTIDEYVKIVIHKYWTDGREKDTTLDPALVTLGLNTSGWIVGTSAKDSPETVVLYSATPLASGDSALLFDSVTVNGDIANKVIQIDNGDGTVTNQFVYDGMTFGIDVEADGVQTHNAEDAILSAWGVKASVNAAGTITSIG